MNKRIYIVCAIVLLTICSCFLIQQININHDLIAYLARGSDFAVSLARYGSEFSEQAIVELMPPPLAFDFLKAYVFAGLAILILSLIISKSFFHTALTIITIGASTIISIGIYSLVSEVSILSVLLSPLISMGVCFIYCQIFLKSYYNECGQSSEKNRTEIILGTLHSCIRSLVAVCILALVASLSMAVLPSKINNDLCLTLAISNLVGFVVVIFLFPALLYFSFSVAKRLERNPIPSYLSSLFLRLARKPARAYSILSVLLVLISISCAFFLPKRYDVLGLDGVQNGSQLAVLVKKGNYNLEGLLIAEFEGLEGILNVEALLTDLNNGFEKEYNSVGFARLVNTTLGEELISDNYSISLYQSYLVSDKIQSSDSPSLSVLYALDVLTFLNTAVESPTYDVEFKNTIQGLYQSLLPKLQSYESYNYSRMLLTLSTYAESQETRQVISQINLRLSALYADYQVVGYPMFVLLQGEKVQMPFVSLLVLSAFSFSALFLVLRCAKTALKAFFALILPLLIASSLIGFVTVPSFLGFTSALIVLQTLGLAMSAVMLSVRQQTNGKNKKIRTYSLGAVADSIPLILASTLIFSIIGFASLLISQEGVLFTFALFVGIGSILTALFQTLFLPCLLAPRDLNSLSLG